MGNWFIKSDEETNPRYGKSPEDRTIPELITTSIINVDKQSGPTSHQVTSWIKDIFHVNKAGHAGTLDPKVTGILIIAMGNAVKAMSVLMGLNKEYVGIMHLHKEIDEEFLRKTITEHFIGKIKQLPPVKSAVARRLRVRRVYYFDITEIDGKDVLFKIRCESGTYIRKIVHDLGSTLGIGAHLLQLRRIRVGHFTEDKSHSLVEIKDAYEFWREENDEKMLKKILIPVEHSILHVKRIFVNDHTVANVTYGAPVYVPGITRIQKGIKRNETVAVYSLKGELVALGIAKMTSKEMYEKKKGTAVRTDRVFMDRDIYPKLNKKV